MSHQEHLFVYGTLRRGFNHPLATRLARQAHFVGLGTVAGRLYDLGTYPGLVAAVDSSDTVWGDVYALSTPAKILPLLDKYEKCLPGQPARSLYLRKEVTISLVAGGSCWGWIYVFNGPVTPFKRIPSGHYLNYLGLKET